MKYLYNFVSPKIQAMTNLLSYKNLWDIVINMAATKDN